MSDSTPISTARRELFELVDRVLERDDIVYIRHRDRPERVALVREGRLRYLESLEEEHPVHPGPIRGSGRLVEGCSVEEVIETIRAGDREREARRTGEWARDE